MKRIRRILLTGMVAFVFGSTIPVVSISAASQTILNEPRADIIEWRYKVENGKMYRRQYNYSKQEWIGDWEYVTDVEV